MNSRNRAPGAWGTRLRRAACGVVSVTPQAKGAVAESGGHVPFCAFLVEKGVEIIVVTPRWPKQPNVWC